MIRRSDFPRVEGAIEEKDLSIAPVMEPWGPSLCIIYKEKAPLWRTGVGLEELDIFLYDPKKDRKKGEMGSNYMIICVDGFDDYRTYGSWKTLEAFEKWKANPKPLY